MSRRVFVTGASGVLGRRVVPTLIDRGCVVTANVRTPAAKREVELRGATACTVDLFDPAAVIAATRDHDVVIHIATSIPTGMNAARRSGWAMNDRLRSDAAANLATAAIEHGARYVGESITFPYVDSGDRLVDENTERAYFWGNQTTVAAEDAAHRVADAGSGGVSLRFGMFVAPDSAHTRQLIALARRGVFGLPGRGDAFISFIDVDDAARAVVAAIDAASGVYNVAEPDPAIRARHWEALAKAVGRGRIRAMPAAIIRLGGEGLVSLARSHRISAAQLSAAADWQPRVNIAQTWSAMT
jgi:nucleoside-diphosphate-sugar epimerase